MSDPISTDDAVWTVNPCSWSDAAKVSTELSIPHVVGMVLAGRGLSDPQAAREFLDCSAPLPDPFLFSDMSAAVKILDSAIDERRRIVVHGDYDADGITATAVMVQGLRELGGEVDWYLPSRFKEGYGLSTEAVETIAAKGAGVLVTVDCGVNYPDEVALARDRGLEVIVVDHHEPGPRLPDCCLIHHTRGDYPHGDLCGVGLALKVMHALHVVHFGADRHALPDSLLGALDLVAVGTVGDLSALRGENRYYVREGLKLLNVGKRLGLRVLCEVVSCSGAVDSGAIAFRLAPRLNAAGRLADPTPPLRLLLSEDETEAKRLAAQLHELNGARQDLERRMFETAREQVDPLESLPPVLVLASGQWHEGVVGIVASRMVELYHRPTVLLCVRDGVAKGSGRSIPAYDLLSGIDSCGHLLSVYGGHAQAAGLTMSADRVDEFRRELEQHASSVLSPSDLQPRYRADAVLSSNDLNTEVTRTLALLEPFGSANPRPRFLLTDTVFEGLEPTRNGLHLRCRAEVGGVKISAIGFGMGQRAHELSADARYVVGAQLKGDEWRGSSRSQLVLERVAAVSAGSSRDDCVGAPGLVAHDDAASSSAKSLPGTEGAERGAGLAGQSDEWPAAVRDLRGQPGCMTSVAQVLGTGEPTIILTTSSIRTLETLRSRLPLEVLAQRGVACVSQGAVLAATASERREELMVVEWGAVVAVSEALAGYAHILVLDPPHRRDQVRVVSLLSQTGATVHLLYGERERAETAALLRYLLHPRFAMVCAYKAGQSNASSEEDARLREALRLGWEQARVSLTREDVRRAWSILSDLGLDTSPEGKAKLDARENAAYREAEADFEECVRSCLTL